MQLFLLQLIRKMTSTARDGGMDEWLSDYHSIRDVNSITMIVELPDEGSAKQDLAICEEYRTYAGGTFGKPSGFGRRYVGAISPLINFDVVCLVVIGARPVNVANGLYILYDCVYVLISYLCLQLSVSISY